MRIDLLMIYDAGMLLPGTKRSSHLPGVDPRFERYLYRFADPGRSRDALVGLVKILPQNQTDRRQA